MRKMAILHKLAGTTWGASDKILKTVYQGTVRPTSNMAPQHGPPPQ